MQSSDQNGTPPYAHPKAAGLEAVVATAVREELQRQGGGGGGDGEIEKRLTAIEGRLGMLEKTVVTKDELQRELGITRGEIGKIPMETIKSLLGITGGLGGLVAVVLTIYNIFFKK